MANGLAGGSGFALFTGTGSPDLEMSPRRASPPPRRPRGPAIGCLRVLAGLAGAALAGPKALAGQSLEVQARAAAPDRPLGGALVTLLDSRGNVVARTLADDQGRARLRVPAGRYAVRVDAIGYEGRSEPAFDLAADAVRRLLLALTPRPLDLGELVVQSSRPVTCRLGREEGTAVAQLWEEARKALLATQLTGRLGTALVELTTFERDLNPRNLVLDERRSTRVGPTVSPFRAVSPELLRREGYVRHDGGEIWFHGPDADLLLSEPFLEDHCFRIRLPAAGGDTVVGLAFEPTRGHRLPDIQGVLWLDGATSELRWVEFGYTGLDLPPDAIGIGGRVEFTRLPSGQWIVGHWQIRMPRLGRRRLAAGVRDTVVGFREAGGEAQLAGVSRPAEPGAVLVGRVTDPTTGLPLAGAVVSIQAGRYADTTDQQGGYRIASPAAGQYLVTLVDPRLALVGLDSLRAAARLERGREDTVNIEAPLFAAAVRALCPGDSARPDRALLLGQVVDSATGRPRAGTEVRVRHLDYRIVTPSAIGERRRELATVTSDAGWFGVCGLPPEAEIQVEVGSPGRPVRTPVRIGSRRQVEVRIAVP